MRKFLFPLGLISLMLLLLFSCRKTEAVAEQADSPQNERFFNVPTTASAQAKVVAKAIRRQDSKHHFVADVIKKAGTLVGTR